MGLTVGPATWHPSNIANIALGSTVCGGTLFCKNGLGTAFIVAPASTQVGATWNGTTSTLVGNKPCVSDWSSLNTALINGGLTPTQWFVPSTAQLQSGYACRTFWDSFSSAVYWSSTESNATLACYVIFDSGLSSIGSKTYVLCVRAFRCVTY
jgi:hypothetical protein